MLSAGKTWERKMDSVENQCRASFHSGVIRLRIISFSQLYSPRRLRRYNIGRVFQLEGSSGDPKGCSPAGAGNSLRCVKGSRAFFHWSRSHGLHTMRRATCEPPIGVLDALARRASGGPRAVMPDRASWNPVPPGFMNGLRHLRSLGFCLERLYLTYSLWIHMVYS